MKEKGEKIVIYIMPKRLKNQLKNIEKGEN